MGIGTVHRFARMAGRALCAAAVLHCACAHAWLLSIGNNTPRRIFLNVGNGSNMADNATVNRVSVTLAAADVGSGVAQQMTSNSTQANSTYDNYLMCNPPVQVYVAALYQRQTNSQSANATLQVTSPANLTSAAGDTIPFSEVSWTVSAPGEDTAPGSIPAGTFNGATQFIVTVAQGTLRDNCHTFSYANTAIRPAGTYDGRVTYTLTSP
jgi:hypothetical protein